MKIFLIVLLSLVGLFILLSIILGIVIVLCSSYPKLLSRENRRIKNEKTGISAGTEGFSREEMTFEMSDGYVIHGDFTRNNLNKIVILAHGHGSNREDCLKYAKIFYSLGYSFLLYDHRGHGDNKKANVSMGFNESKDLYEIFEIISAKYPEAKIGLFGYSMGAVSTLLSTKYTQKPAFIIADCPYSSLKIEFNDSVWKYKFPPFLACLFANLTLKLFFKSSFKKVNPNGIIHENNVPILLFHGKSDQFVNYKHQDLIAENLTCYYEKYLFENAKHDECILVDEKRYKEIVEKFIEKVTKN